MPEFGLVIDIVGEGKSDLGRGDDLPGRPSSGVVPVLVHRLCNEPESMQVRRRPLPFLQEKGLWKKVRFAKRQGFYAGSAGLIFVLDTEGNHPGVLNELRRGRDSVLLEYPTVVGVAHPCIGAWLLSDGAAISRAMNLVREATIPPNPESLPAPCKDRSNSPKAVLSRCAGQNRHLASYEMTCIVKETQDLSVMRNRCPTSFSPFADEVIAIIGVLFRPDEDSQGGLIDIRPAVEMTAAVRHSWCELLPERSDIPGNFWKGQCLQ